jgi:hypothetical protein
VDLYAVLLAVVSIRPGKPSNLALECKRVEWQLPIDLKTPSCMRYACTIDGVVREPEANRSRNAGVVPLVGLNPRSRKRVASSRRRDGDDP